MNGRTIEKRSDDEALGRDGIYDFAPKEPPSYEMWFWGLCIFLLTGPFVYQLTGLDPSQKWARDLTTMRRTEGSGVLLYVIRMAVMVVAIGAILPYWRMAVTRLTRMAPLLLFLCWVMMSLLWSDTFVSTLNGLMALVPVVVVGFCLALRLPPHLFARSFIYAGAFMAAASLFYVIALPHFGVHQQSDAVQSVHAGAWRGVYAHKNVFGSVCAVYAIATIVSGRAVLPSLWIRGILLALLLLMVVKSDSATALAIVAIVPVVVLAIVGLTPIQSIVALCIIAPTATLIYVELETIFGLFGRDLTLTGRTTVWSLALEFVAKSPFIGYGYASTTYGGFMLELFRRTGMFDPHNGYLNVVLSTGIVGLIMFLTTFISQTIVARRLFTMGGANRAAAITVFSFTLSWLVAMMTESQDKPMGGFAALAFTSLGLMVYRNPASMPTLTVEADQDGAGVGHAHSLPYPA